MGGTSLFCPQCGGRVRPEEEDAFVACEFCGSRLYLDPGKAVRHEMLPAVVPRAELPGRLGRWLADLEAIGRPTNIATRLLFVPFWIIAGNRHTRIEPAAALLVHGLSSFRLPPGDTKTFEDDLVAGGQVIPVSVLLSTALAAGPDAGASEPLEAPPGTRLVHLPFWEVSFRLGGGDHRAWIDAASGQILPFSAPASSGGRLDRIYAAILAACFVVLLAGFLLVFSGAGAGFLGLALLAAGGPAGWWAARAAMARSEQA